MKLHYTREGVEAFQRGAAWQIKHGVEPGAEASQDMSFPETWAWKKCICDDWLKLEAEVERLQAEIAKLPKTADGVPVIPGEPLFWLDPTTKTIHKADIMGSPMGLFPECYSTQAAAEAARRKGGSKTDDE